MTHVIPINIIVEDSLSESVVQKLITHTGRTFVPGKTYGLTGNGYLKRNIRGFNNAAKGTPYLLLTDLDNVVCPSSLIDTWLPVPRHPNLLFRVAVREVEAWLLADREGFADFLGVAIELIPQNVEELEDPKRVLVNIASHSRKRELRSDIVPATRSTALQGPNYNGCLISYVNNTWNLEKAINESASLCRTAEILRSFSPTYE